MQKLLINNMSALILILIFSSCRPNRNLVYFSDLNKSENYSVAVPNMEILIIQTNDLLSIRLSSLNQESNALFNRGILQLPNPTSTSISADVAVSDSGYLVDSEGYVDFPVLGKVKLAGLRIDEATEKMTSALSQYVKSPIVTVRILNFKITVIGEVNRPSSFIVPTGHINILEALGLAGDMTAYGRRENVLLVREKGGMRSTTRLNLNNKELLSSPYFYLQQNDVIYVVPDRLKEVQASTNTRTLAVATVAVSIVVALIFNFRYF